MKERKKERKKARKKERKKNDFEMGGKIEKIFEAS